MEGSTNAVVFETCVEMILKPTLEPGQVVEMDNLSARKGQRVKELIEGQRSEFLYLPPYSQDFNPNEEISTKIRASCEKLRLAPERP